MFFEFNENNFSHAIFTDNERSRVDVYYKNEQNKTFVYSMEVRASSPDFQHLMTIVTMEQIEQMTGEYINKINAFEREYQRQLISSGEVEIDTSAAQAELEVKFKEAIEALKESVFNFMHLGEEDVQKLNEAELEYFNDALFDTKLRCFDLDKVIAADQETKDKIRLAKTPLEVYTVVNSIHS